MITICFTYFRSLTKANLRAALYSLRQQDMSCVDSIVVVDNNTDDPAHEVQFSIDLLAFPVPVRLISIKHGDENKTHSWSTNLAVSEASTPWVLFCRADYLLDFSLVDRFVKIAGVEAHDWNGFVTANVYHLNADIEACDRTSWRAHGPKVLRGMPGAENDYTSIDSGVWMARRSAFEAVRGLDENLTAWGHAQTHFQNKMYKAGATFVRIPEVLFYHPQHSAPRDIELAHRQLKDEGFDVREMWQRYEGVRPY